MNSKFAWLLTVLLSLPLIMLPSAAHATSIYDTTYKSTDTLVQSGYYGCSAQDITYSWSNYLTNDEFSGVEESFALAKSQGRWGVSVSYGQVNVLWTEDTSLYLDWTDPVYGGGYSVMAKGDDVHRAEFSLSGYYYDKPCMPYISSYQTDAGAVTIITDKFGYSKNLFVVTDYPNYPSGYDGALLVTDEPKAEYVAMGDSFSSGEGNPAFEPGTDIATVNECHRSIEAYPRQLQDQAVLGPTAFVACSGATTHDVLTGKNGEPSQLNALSSETEVVTITVGGNDIKFKEFATACGLIVVNSCSQTSDEYQESWLILTDDTRSDYLPDALVEVYKAIATELGTSNTSARVLVVGYPYVTSYQEWSDAPSVSSTNCPTLNGAEAFAAETLVDQLNAVISDTVDALGDSRFEFIDPTDPLVSDFPDHTVCRSNNWFNRINLTLPEVYTFHPNADGVEEYTRILMDAL